MPVIKSQFTMRLDLETHCKIKKIAKAKNRSLTNLIETLVKQEISSYEEEHGPISVSPDELTLE